MWACVYQWPHVVASLSRQLAVVTTASEGARATSADDVAPASTGDGKRATAADVTCHAVPRFLHEFMHRWSVYYNRLAQLTSNCFFLQIRTCALIL